MEMESKGGYFPSEKEAYMSESQLQFFRQQLTREQQRLKSMMRESLSKLQNLQIETADPIDKSRYETEISMELKETERFQTRLRQIRLALDRIDKGRFGYCSVTGREIGLKRMMALPFTTMSIAAKEMIEKTTTSPGSGIANSYAVEGLL